MSAGGVIERISGTADGVIRVLAEMEQEMGREKDKDKGWSDKGWGEVWTISVGVLGWFGRWIWRGMYYGATALAPRFIRHAN